MICKRMNIYKTERPVVGAQKQVFWAITPHHGCLFIACSLSAHLTYPHNVCFHLAGLIWINPKNFKQTKKTKKTKKPKKPKQTKKKQ